jgi:type II secretory pathway pseudopilin PulG
VSTVEQAGRWGGGIGFRKRDVRRVCSSFHRNAIGFFMAFGLPAFPRMTSGQRAQQSRQKRVATIVEAARGDRLAERRSSLYPTQASACVVGRQSWRNRNAVGAVRPLATASLQRSTASCENGYMCFSRKQTLEGRGCLMKPKGGVISDCCASTALTHV